MNMCLLLNLPDRFYRTRTFLLSVLFLLGHLLGVLISGYTSGLLLSVMRTVVSSRVSIIGLFSTLALPFLLSAFAVYLAQPVVLFPIAFWKAFLFSYVGSCFAAAWGSAGWLMAPLAMGGSLLSMPVLYWYWSRHINGQRFLWRTFCAAVCALAVAGIIDWYFIEPFLARIITF